MELKVKSRSYDEIVFSYPTKDGFFYLVFAAALAAFGVVFRGENVGASYLLITGSAVVTVIALLMIRWRHTLIIRPLSRKYERVYGSWPGALKHQSGTFQDIRGLVLETIRQQVKSPEYFISISLTTVDRLLSIDDARFEDEAIKKLHEWSRELGLEIIEKV